MRKTARMYSFHKLEIIERIRRGETTAAEEASKLDPPGTIAEVNEWLRLYDTKGRDAFIKRESGSGARRDAKSTKARRT